MPEYTMKQYKEKIDRWMKQYPKDAEIALATAGWKVHEEVITNHLSGPKMDVGEGSKTHGTLQPRSSFLKGSITVRVEKLGNGRLKGMVGNFLNPLKYAKIHEYGGMVGKVRMPERSYLRSSLAKKKKVILDTILKAIKRSYNNV